jgi:hypothetical protein
VNLKQRLMAMWLLFRGWGVCVGCDFTIKGELTVNGNKKKQQHICFNTFRVKEED